MGFLATGPWDESSLRDIRDDTIDRQIARYLDRDDIVTTVMNTFVSTTVQCARCHNHKFDPISQEEYYGLQAVFAATDKASRTYDADPPTHARRRALLKQRRAIDRKEPALIESLREPVFQNELAAWERTLTNRAVVARSDQLRLFQRRDSHQTARRFSPFVWQTARNRYLHHHRQGRGQRHHCRAPGSAH